MKKILLTLAAVVALSLVSCDVDYKSKGESYAKQLDELCQKQDSAAVLELDKTIRETEEKIVESGDTEAFALFTSALKEVRQRNAAYIASLKVKQGLEKDSVINEVIGDVMQGDMSIEAVTNSVDATLDTKKKK